MDDVTPEAKRFATVWSTGLVLYSFSLVLASGTLQVLASLIMAMVSAGSLTVVLSEERVKPPRLMEGLRISGILFAAYIAICITRFGALDPIEDGLAPVVYVASMYIASSVCLALSAAFILPNNDRSTPDDG